MNNKLVILVVAIGIILGLLCGGMGPLAALAGIAFVTAAALMIFDHDVAVFFLAGYGVLDVAIRAFAGGISSIWDELFLIGLVGLWGIKWIMCRDEDNFKVTPVDFPLFLFIAAMVICLVLNSSDFSVGVEGFRAIVQYMLWYFVVIQLVNGERSAKAVTLCFVLIVGLLALYGVYQYAIGVEMPAGWVDQNEAGVRTRVFSIFTSPNIFGSLLTLAIPMTVSLALMTKKTLSRIFFCLVALVMLASLVFTFSRGAWIGFMLAAGIYILLKDKRFIIPAVILAVLVVAAVPSVGDRIGYMLSPEYIESSLRGGRLVRWLTGLEILKNNLLLGVGLGHFGGAVAMNNGMKYLVGYTWTDTFYMDNNMLKMAVESGLLGFGAFMILMYSVVINSFRTIKLSSTKASRELSTGILAGLCGVIAHNFFENVFETPMMTSLFWLFVAIIMGIWYEENKKISSEKE